MGSGWPPPLLALPRAHAARALDPVHEGHLHVHQHEVELGRIVALSANGDDEACQRDCLAAGLDGVHTKPVDVSTLCALLGVSPPSRLTLTLNPNAKPEP